MRTRLRCAVQLGRLMLAYLITFQWGALWFALRHGHSASAEEAEREIARLTNRLFGPGFRLAGLKVTVDPDCPPPLAELPADRPVVVVARHAGPLNGLLLLHVITSVLGRRPAGVCKRCMVVVPGIGALLRPTRIVPFRSDSAGRVFALRTLMRQAAQAGPGDGLGVFPEGTGLTARRRVAALADLARGRNRARVGDYTRLRHLLPPYPAGLAALLAFAPDADVIVVGHTGLEDLLGAVTGIGYPLRPDGELHLAFWRIPAHEVPRKKAEVEAWLLDWWQRLDVWIARTRNEPSDVVVPPPFVPRPRVSVENRRPELS